MRRRNLRLAKHKQISAQQQKLVEAKSWEREIEIATAAVTQATEQLKLAQAQLSDTTLKSPINGVIATQHLSRRRLRPTRLSTCSKTGVYSRRSRCPQSGLEHARRRRIPH